ncbi:MAG: hypothetical protein H0U22_08855 [Geodermatophilaceae bacterium]|nr:hypothetical protein [Geodermatophilaceae bacterium]
MTPSSLMVLAGALLVSSALVSWLMSWNFCTRPAPRWLRSWRDVALAMVGARAVYVGVVGAPASWWSVALWLLLGAWGCAIAGFNLHAALIKGDRCPA